MVMNVLLDAYPPKNDMEGSYTYDEDKLKDLITKNNIKKKVDIEALLIEVLNKESESADLVTLLLSAPEPDWTAYDLDKLETVTRKLNTYLENCNIVAGMMKEDAKKKEMEEELLSVKKEIARLESQKKELEDKLAA